MVFQADNLWGYTQYISAGYMPSMALMLTLALASRQSSGCIRLRNDDIKYLFDHVPAGTRVQIIDRPVKFSVEPDAGVVTEVHEPLSVNRAEFGVRQKVPRSRHASAARTLIKGMTLILRVNEVLERRSECRSTLARAGPVLNILHALLVFMGWSICISSECHGRGFIFNEPLALRLSL